MKQFDSEYLEDMSGGDSEFVHEIVSTFLETAKDLVAAITAAAADGDLEKAFYAAHTLKGSARSVGAIPLGDFCEELEKLAKSGDVAAYSTLAARTPGAFSLLVDEISSMLESRAA